MVKQLSAEMKKIIKMLPDDYLFGSDLMPGKVPCGLFRFDKEWNKVRNAPDF